MVGKGGDFLEAYSGTYAVELQAAAGGRLKGADPLGLTKLGSKEGMEGGRMSVRLCRAGTGSLVLPPHSQAKARCTHIRR